MHVGIILDGNRRLAKKLMLKPWQGHELGAKKVEKLFDWCKEFGVEELTLYALSVDNLNKRPRQELEYLLDLFKKEFTKLLNDKRIDENQVRIRVIGRKHLLPEEFRRIIKEIEKKTESYNNFIVNFAIAYGGREEIIDAINSLIKDLESSIIKPPITPEKFEEYLYLKEKPDLIIRTGGEKRTSNFLIWQANYSEWFFLDKSWPEFEKEDFKAILEEFNKRQRRFGR